MFKISKALLEQMALTYIELYNALQKDQQKIGACTKKKTQCLKSYINQFMQLKQAPLPLAATYGHIDVLRGLLDAGASIESKNTYKATALICACEKGHAHIVNELLKLKPLINSKDENEITALITAAANGHNEIVKTLFNQGANIEDKDECQATALINAAENGHIDVVRTLIGFNANIEACDKQLRTPLLIATENGHTHVVTLLLKANARVNVKDREGNTPLIWAAAMGYECIVTQLIEKEACLDQKSLTGMNALYWAALKGNTEVVRLLLEQGACYKKINFSLSLGISEHILHRSQTVLKVQIEQYNKLIKTLTGQLKGKDRMIDPISLNPIRAKDEKGKSSKLVRITNSQNSAVFYEENILRLFEDKSDREPAQHPLTREYFLKEDIRQLNIKELLAASQARLDKNTSRPLILSNDNRPNKRRRLNST